MWDALPCHTAHHDGIPLALTIWLSGGHSGKILHFLRQTPRQLACLTDPIVCSRSNDERYAFH
jgi:hypothetical protein